MILIVGLGNPGGDYSSTRHNTGYMFIDELQKHKLSEGVVARKTNVFMNESGAAVKKLVNQYKLKPTDLYIVHDDLDIMLGEFKIQFGRGPRDHNGLKSVDTTLGTNEYWHVRIGVDTRPSDNRPAGEEYILQHFTEKERKIIDGVIKSACKKLEILFKSTK